MLRPYKGNVHGEGKVDGAGADLQQAGGDGAQGAAGGGG